MASMRDIKRRKESIQSTGQITKAMKLVSTVKLQKAKMDRSTKVSNIVVEVDGMKFDGDETSQDRMARSLLILKDDETAQWVLADNTIAEVTKDQLSRALRLAGEYQMSIWSIPYLS